ncbi:tRNA nucleotidyltransferase/poly(A) polymerase [Clostridium pasteurianum BC1]|uniref:tRNA nucleotidyltransferase/poly(A) polymerase n=2 Tax=Clostridium pasteurianum TaxID=1501 RepID=R4JWT6_CLOPA|nr:tRNA nucleotidyltransferase/poly(A) polymerase [Clostridium pasteurianum BC1]
MVNIIKEMKKALIDLGGDAYLVGDYVREKLIKPEVNIKKMKILYSEDINELFKLFKEKLNYNIRFYNNKKVLIIENEGFIVEIWKLTFKSIEEYLENMDYTMNAVALKLTDNKIIDPYQGRIHIKRRIIQEINDKSIEKHPLSILKGIAYYMGYGMHFSINTELHIKEQSKNLKNKFGNTLLRELMHIINIDKNGVAFNILDQYSILENILPYTKELKTIGKCKYHLEDAFTHMNAAYELLKEIQAKKIELQGLDLELLSEDMEGYKLIDFLALAVFVHDIGKFKNYKKVDNKVSFAGHEIAGENIMREVCKQLDMPKAAQELICTVVEAHMYPLSLYKIKKNENEFKKELNKFFNKYSNYSIYIIIASYCDILATNIYYDSQHKAEEYKIFIEELIEMK